MALPANVKFQRARRLIRDALIEEGVAPRIERLVAGYLGSKDYGAKAGT